jgi:hypothetical protein
LTVIIGILYLGLWELNEKLKRANVALEEIRKESE